MCACQSACEVKRCMFCQTVSSFLGCVEAASQPPKWTKTCAFLKFPPSRMYWHGKWTFFLNHFTPVFSWIPVELQRLILLDTRNFKGKINSMLHYTNLRFEQKYVFVTPHTPLVRILHLPCLGTTRYQWHIKAYTFHLLSRWPAVAVPRPGCKFS